MGQYESKHCEEGGHVVPSLATLKGHTGPVNTLILIPAPPQSILSNRSSPQPGYTGPADLNLLSLYKKPTRNRAGTISSFFKTSSNQSIDSSNNNSYRKTSGSETTGANNFIDEELLILPTTQEEVPKLDSQLPFTRFPDGSIHLRTTVLSIIPDCIINNRPATDEEADYDEKGLIKRLSQSDKRLSQRDKRSSMSFTSLRVSDKKKHPKLKLRERSHSLFTPINNSSMQEVITLDHIETLDLNTADDDGRPLLQKKYSNVSSKTLTKSGSYNVTESINTISSNTTALDLILTITPESAKGYILFIITTENVRDAIRVPPSVNLSNLFSLLPQIQLVFCVPCSLLRKLTHLSQPSLSSFSTGPSNAIMVATTDTFPYTFARSAMHEIQRILLAIKIRRLEKDQLQLTDYMSANDTLLSASSDGTIKFWDLNTGAILYNLEAQAGGVSNMFLIGKTLESKIPTYLVTYSQSRADTTIRIWSLVTFILIVELTDAHNDSWITSIEPNFKKLSLSTLNKPDSNKFPSTNNNNNDASSSNTESAPPTTTISSSSVIIGLVDSQPSVISRSGLLFSSDATGKIACWDIGFLFTSKSIATNKSAPILSVAPRWVSQTHAGHVTCLYPSRKGLISAGASGIIAISDVVTGTSSKTKRIHDKAIWSIRCIKNDQYNTSPTTTVSKQVFVSSGDDYKISIWDDSLNILNSTKTQFIARKTRKIANTLFFYGASDEFMSIDLKSGKLSAPYNSHTNDINGLYFVAKQNIELLAALSTSPSGVSSGAGAVTNSPILGHKQGIISKSVFNKSTRSSSPNTELLSHPHLKLPSDRLNLSTVRLQASDLKQQLHAEVVGRKKQSDKNSSSGSHQFNYYEPQSVSEFYGISISKDKTVKIWDMNKKRPFARLLGHTGPVNCALNYYSTILITASMDSNIKIWKL